MKKVRMNVAMGGPTVNYAVGGEYELDDALADALCSDGRAEFVESETRKRSRKRATPAARAEKR